MHHPSLKQSVPLKQCRPRDLRPRCPSPGPGDYSVPDPPGRGHAGFWRSASPQQLRRTEAAAANAVYCDENDRNLASQVRQRTRQAPAAVPLRITAPAFTSRRGTQYDTAVPKLNLSKRSPACTIPRSSSPSRWFQYDCDGLVLCSASHTLTEDNVLRTSRARAPAHESRQGLFALRFCPEGTFGACDQGSAWS